MASVDSTKFHDGVSIRDTNPVNGIVVNSYDYILKTIIVENDLNQAVSLQCQASLHSDFSKSFNVGSAFEVAAGAYTYQTCTTYFPYMRLVATCTVAPTSGTLTVYSIRYKEL